MVNFIEFPIFDGVSGDLRAWISWLEDFFVRERFTEDEKMNLAQSLLEGEANAWFYSSRKRFAFQSWEHLVVELLLWRFGYFGDGGVFSDLELFLLWNKYDRILRKQRRKRMDTTSLNLQESISNQQKIVEEFPENVAENAVSRESSSAQDLIEKDESHEATLIQVEGDTTMFQISDSLEEESITQHQVPISSLEPRLSFSSEPLDVSASWPCAIVSNNPVHSQSVLDCVKNKNNAHHVFDELLLRRHHVLHDPGGKKDDYSDDIFEAKVDIDNGQRPQVDTVAESMIITPENVVESVITAPDNVAELVITAPAIVASSSTDAASSTAVITTRQRWDEACDAEIDVLDGTATWIVHSQPANNIEEDPGNRLLALDQKETVSAYVTAFEELSTQVIGLEDSHLEQVFNEGLKTAMQEVLKLTAPVRLENQKKSRCLKASLFNFKRKHKRIKRSHNHQQQQLKRKFTKSWSFKYKGFVEAVDVTQVTLLLQLILDDLKSHMRHKWESKLRLHSGCDGEKLPELDFHFGVNHGLLVFPWNLLPLEFFWFFHLEDKVCLSGASNSWCGWLVFDRGKSNIITGEVITLVSIKEFWIEIMDGDIAKLLNSTCGKLQSYDYGLEITFLRRLRVHQQQQKRKFIKSWRFKYKSSLRNTRSESRELKQFVGFVKFQLKHKWRSKHLHTISALGFYLSSVFSIVTSANSGRLQGLLEQVVQRDDEAYTKILDKLQLNLKQGLDVHGASGLRLFLRQQTFSSIRHRWRRKDWDLEVQLRKRDLMVAYSLRLPPGSTTHDSSENSWMFSNGFVSLFPTFKLEDKLVLQGESIDTITNRIIGRRIRT